MASLSSKKTAIYRTLTPCIGVAILTILLEMSNTRWLLLTDYASKYRISVSTLRRRIKTGQQAHRFESGRYYLPDEPGSASVASVAPMIQTVAHSAVQETEPVNARHIPLKDGVSATVADEPLITTTSKLLNELKQAYTLILQEKEEQILHLKEEIADLKTLVRVLESDNARLRPLRNERPIGNA